MQEEYLHYVWRMKRLDFNKLYLSNSSHSKVHVKEIGWYNLDAGPDFFNGTVDIDGILWSGNIEMHINSSDWYAHKHHLDPAYDNVVLHVVYNHDQEVYVDDRALPTIELKHLIDEQHLSLYESIAKADFRVPCYAHVPKLKFSLLQQINVSFVHRIERKGLALLQDVSEVSKNKGGLFMAALFKAVGGRTNKLPMLELAQLIPLNVFYKEKWDLTRLEALLYGCAGMLNDDIKDPYYLELVQQWNLIKNKHQLQEMRKTAWKYSGMRPPSFPTFLIAQLAAIFYQLDYSDLNLSSSEQIISKISNMDSGCINSYWKNHYVFGKISRSIRALKFSPILKNNLIINGIVPYLLALKHHESVFSYSDTAIALLESYPAEQNKVTKYWGKLGFLAQNALESQGLLELNNEFCKFNKCLSCKVGCEILEGK
ncbi:hypothetical protein CW751_11905 [Brumimicrobium salinarum]|uniref:DUF2851 domain-containing protein n=1 Tax=Brumimicrobium salinarum TaxID=2058658 RepID=A0A2I0R0F8_9FLAO|nr:DUF2851 family protein [Brumimicrobium salinarum]PKR80064.1 hypothetical protein CW751_11905 [Brumimicrobium salinarum]